MIAGAVLWACQPATADQTALGSSIPPGGSCAEKNLGFASGKVNGGNSFVPGRVGGMDCRCDSSYCARTARLLRSVGVSGAPVELRPSSGSAARAIDSTTPE